ncbi:unnamed protein product [Closterium sp. NIES-64]|nr:unnamed protein product [Closterium sp. NIES-64]
MLYAHRCSIAFPTLLPPMDSFPSPPLLPAPSPPRATVATLPRRLASPGRIGWERGAAQCRAEKEASGAERGVDSGNEGMVGGAAMRWRGGHQDREQPNDSDSNEGSDPGRRKRRERRTFSKSAREECWKQAAMVEGRSGERCARGEAGRGVEGADGMCKGMGGGGGGGGGGARFVRRSGRRWGGWSWCTDGAHAHMNVRRAHVCVAGGGGTCWATWCSDRCWGARGRCASTSITLCPSPRYRACVLPARITPHACTRTRAGGEVWLRQHMAWGKHVSNQAHLTATSLVVRLRWESCGRLVKLLVVLGLGRGYPMGVRHVHAWRGSQILATNSFACLVLCLLRLTMSTAPPYAPPLHPSSPLCCRVAHLTCTTARCSRCAPPPTPMLRLPMLMPLLCATCSALCAPFFHQPRPPHLLPSPPSVRSFPIPWPRPLRSPSPSSDRTGHCQVAANRAKGSAVSDSWRQDAQPMSTRQPSGEDMDVLELAAYGDVWHGTTRYVLHSPACDRLQHPSSTRRATAGTMKHSKVGGSKAAASSARGSGCTLQ